jgi:hypothetical protein
MVPSRTRSLGVARDNPTVNTKRTKEQKVDEEVKANEVEGERSNGCLQNKEEAERPACRQFTSGQSEDCPFYSSRYLYISTSLYICGSINKPSISNGSMHILL